MIPHEQMPEDNAELAQIAVEFPRLNPDSTESCPTSMQEILEYLWLESPDGESLQVGQLEFIRTALVGEHRYWIWQFSESSGAHCYVTVSITSEGDVLTGYDENYYRLTPEQFMLGDYHGVF